jgi:hypothetical protein
VGRKERALGGRINRKGKCQQGQRTVASEKRVWVSHLNPEGGRSDGRSLVGGPGRDAAMIDSRGNADVWKMVDGDAMTRDPWALVLLLPGS